MTFRTDDEQSAEFLDLITQDDVRTTSGNVGCQRDGALLTCTGDNLSLLGVVLGVQDIMLYTCLVQQRSDVFILLNTGGTDQDRLTLFLELLNLFDDGAVFGGLCLEDCVCLPTIKKGPFASFSVAYKYHTCLLQGFQIQG